MGDCLPALREVLVEAGSNATRMVEKVAICEQRSDQGRFDSPGPAELLRRKPYPINQPSSDALATTRTTVRIPETRFAFSDAWIVERPFEATDNLSDDCDGMRYAPVYPIGITDDRIQQEREHQNKIRLRAAQIRSEYEANTHKSCAPVIGASTRTIRGTTSRRLRGRNDGKNRNTPLRTRQP